MLVVQKYGGSSVANAERIDHVAKRIVETQRKGNRVIVILSAQGDTTDDLIAKAKEITETPSKRELDMLLATGEQISVSLMAMAIQKLGANAISLNSAQVGIETRANYGSARIKRVNTERIDQELERNNIVIVTGFQGINKFDDITTLGRGGSDTSAVAIAAAMHADICEIYTDVDGIYTADPRIVPNAKKLPEISYDEMLELATLGAGVLHNRSVELARKYGVALVVRSSMNNEEGTVVKGVNSVERMTISGVTVDKDVARVTVRGIKDQPGKAFELFNLIMKNNIALDIIIQAIGENNTTDISFTVATPDLQKTVQVIQAEQSNLGYKELLYDEDIAKVSIVGVGMVSNTEVAVNMFEALYDEDVNIKMIGSSEMKLSVIIRQSDYKKAVLAIHDKFHLSV